eukprot:Rmarinus@m.1548
MDQVREWQPNLQRDELSRMRNESPVPTGVVENGNHLDDNTLDPERLRALLIQEKQARASDSHRIKMLSRDVRNLRMAAAKQEGSGDSSDNDDHISAMGLGSSVQTEEDPFSPNKSGSLTRNADSIVEEVQAMRNTLRSLESDHEALKSRHQQLYDESLRDKEMMIDFEREIANLRSQRESLREQLKKYEAELAKPVPVVKEKRPSLASMLTGSSNKKVKAEFEEMSKLLQEANRKVVQLEERLSWRDSENIQLKDEAKLLRREASDLRRVLDEKDKEIAAVPHWETKAKALESANKMLSAKLAAASQTQHEKEPSAVTRSQDFMVLQHTLRTKETELLNARSRVERLESERHELNDENKKLRRRVADLKRSIEMNADASLYFDSASLTTTRRSPSRSRLLSVDGQSTASLSAPAATPTAADALGVDDAISVASASASSVRGGTGPPPRGRFASCSSPRRSRSPSPASRLSQQAGVSPAVAAAAMAVERRKELAEMDAADDVSLRSGVGAFDSASVYSMVSTTSVARSSSPSRDVRAGSRLYDSAVRQQQKLDSARKTAWAEETKTARRNSFRATRGVARISPERVRESADRLSDSKRSLLAEKVKEEMEREIKDKRFRRPNEKQHSGNSEVAGQRLYERAVQQNIRLRAKVEQEEWKIVANANTVHRSRLSREEIEASSERLTDDTAKQQKLLQLRQKAYLEEMRHMSPPRSVSVPSSRRMLDMYEHAVESLAEKERRMEEFRERQRQAELQEVRVKKVTKEQLSDVFSRLRSDERRRRESVKQHLEETLQSPGQSPSASPISRSRSVGRSAREKPGGSLWDRLHEEAVWKKKRVARAVEKKEREDQATLGKPKISPVHQQKLFARLSTSRLM